MDARPPSMRCAQIDRREQRRFSEDVPLIDVGARLDQLLRQVPVGVHDRHEQRRHAIGIRQVDVRLVLEQHLHARRAVLARGIEQRRQSAAVQVLGTPLGRHVTLVVAIDGARVDVGALGDQQLHHLRMPARRRPHQRGLSAPLLLRIDGGAVVQQQLARLPRCRFSQPRGAPSVRRHWVIRRSRRLRAAPSACRCCRLRRRGSSAWRRSCWRAPRWRRRAAVA